MSARSAGSCVRSRVVRIPAPLVVLLLHVSASAPVWALAECAASQTVAVDSTKPWACQLSTATASAYLLRAQQDNADVVLEVVEPRAEKRTVDAPGRRASPELLLVGASGATRKTIQVRSIDRERGAGDVKITVEEIRLATGNPLAGGLQTLTEAAALAAGNSGPSMQERIELLRKAMTQFSSARARELNAEALFRVAGIYYWALDDYVNSADTAKDAMHAFVTLGDPLMQARAGVLRAAALLEIANALRQQGRRVARPEQTQFDEAVDLLQDASRYFRSAGLMYDDAHATNFLGIAYYYQGDYVSARARYVEAARYFRTLHAETSAALPLQNIAMIDYDTGDYTRAIDSYHSLLGVLLPTDSAGQYVAVLLNLGLAQYALGDFDDALRTFIQSLQLSERNEFVAEQARSLHNLGMVYLVIGERERAAAYLERALVMRRSLVDSDPRGLQTSLLRVGDLKRENGDVRAALDLHLEALDRAKTVMQRARALHSIGLDHEANDAPRSALQAYETAMQLELPREAPVGVAIMGAYGRVKMRTGDESGRALIVQAAQLQESSGNEDLAAAGYLSLAEEDRRGRRLDAALTNVRRALSLYESQRLRTITPDLRATYVANRGAGFELQSDVLMRMGQAASATREKEQYQLQALLAYDNSRRRVLEDFRELAQSGAKTEEGSALSQQLAELDAQITAKRHRLAAVMDQANPSQAQVDTLRNDIALLRTRLDLVQAKAPTLASAPSAFAPQPKSLREIQRAIESDGVLLAYQMGDDRSWMWCVTADTMSAYQLPGRSELQAAARRLYGAWSNPASAPDKRGEIAASRLLLAGAAETLRKKRRLTVVPDGDLRSIPYAALWLESGSSSPPARLVETHAIVFRPTVARDAQSQDRPSNRILLVGDPTVATSKGPAAESWSDPWAARPLPGSRREIESIEAIASGWRSYVLLGADATKPALLSLPLDTFRTLHFATHARLDVLDPQLSSITLSSRDAGNGASTSALSVREIVGFRLHAETVVLSACEASLGKDYRGHLSFGLSEAFLLAGARNVLGSLWRVSDDAAQAYMQSFYGEYVRNDATPADAAQVATRALARKPEFSHPYFWAAFAVTQQ